jgi:S-adenosylmethionine:tRNA ribosyltransferase-isomerase
MLLSEFDYELPPKLIAQVPTPERHHSRLLVLDRETGAMDHRHFYDLPDMIQDGDSLVINETKVVPARLLGEKVSGGKVEILLLRRREQETTAQVEEGSSVGEWECLVKNSGKLRCPARVILEEDLEAELVEKSPAGSWLLRLKGKGNLDQTLRRIGYPPLPPYIRRNGNRETRALDLERYQTVYARHEGAIAAPTAGLHFTPELLGLLKKKGVQVFPVTLHVGRGTFVPVKEEVIEKHRLEPETFEVPPETAARLNRIRQSGGKVIAVGTTVTRALESITDEEGILRPQKGRTDLFIRPGHRFRAIDGLITNFHLPRSTLLMLVAAFAGRELIRSAYEEAIKRNYRFYSYGDAMLIR